MGKLKITQTPLPGVLVIEPAVFADERGFFLESYNQKDFAAAGLTAQFVQDNHSRSRQGVLRGLHYQLQPAAQAKLVSCPHGRIFDVAVDLRRGSATYGRWHGALLSGENHRLLYLPVGFAHGFLALAEENDVLYKCTAPFSPELDRGIIWDDPDLAIAWPLDQAGGRAIVSGRDLAHPRFQQAENNFTFHA